MYIMDIKQQFVYNKVYFTFDAQDEFFAHFSKLLEDR